MTVAGAIAVAVGALLTTPVASHAAAPTGLTSAQARELQTPVDGYLAKMGGTQVAPNQIRLPSGADLVLPLPGEQTARHLGDVSASSVHGCPSHYLCAYAGQNFTGPHVDGFYCSTDYTIPWVQAGSYVNNQTPGTVGHFKDERHLTLFNTFGAYSEDNIVNWLDVFFMQPCG